MNKIYKVIWSKVKHQYVVTSEFAHSCTKSTTSRVGKSAVAALAAFVLTAGVGGMSVQATDTTSANQETLLAMQLSSSKDKNDVTVVPVVLDEQIGSTQTSKEEQIAAQESVQNDEGFYVRNGDKGTYNSLTKDGLWVGGTSNTTGFHVDNDGNIHTTGNAEVDGAFNAANGNVTIDADGTTYVHVGQSELQVTDNQAVLRHGNNSVIVNNDGVSVAGDVAADNSVKVGLIGYDSDNNFAPIYGTEIGADGSFSTAQGSFSVDKDGNVWAADGNVTIDADGTTYVHANRSELQVTDNQAVLRHGNNSVIVNNDGVSVAGDVTADNSVKVGLIRYDSDNNFAPIYGTEIGADGSFSTAKGAFKVEAEGTVTSKNDIYIGSQKEDNKVVTKSQLNSVSDDISAYKNAGIVAGSVDETVTNNSSIAIGTNATVSKFGDLHTPTNAIAIGNSAGVHNWNAVAIGANSNVYGENSVAIGKGASTTVGGWNSVSLGWGSVADQSNVISVGSETNQRRIINVANGTNATDAATVGQMNQLIFGAPSGSRTSLGLTNTGTSLVDGINKNTNAINALSNEIFGSDYDFSIVGTNLTTMQAKMANFESVLSKLDVDALSEVSTMSLTPSEVEGSREPSEGGSTGGSEIQTGGNASYSGNVSVGKDLTVNGNSTFKGTATFEQGADMNGQKITNVGDGAVEAGSKDAVNGGQLYNVQQDVQANSSAINSLGSRVSDLGDEIDSVGAISAALAGLHPLDYDGTGSKFQISAAMGTYDGTQAAAIGGFYHFNRDVMMSIGGATSFEGDKKTAANIGVTFRVGEGASGKSVSDDVMARLEAMDQKIAALEQENKDLKNVLGAIDTSLSKEFPDVPANHWAYEAVTKLAGNDVVAGYPDGEFHGDRTMTRYEMAEIIYKAMSKGVQVDQKLVNEFKPEMEQVAANQNA